LTLDCAYTELREPVDESVLEELERVVETHREVAKTSTKVVNLVEILSKKWIVPIVRRAKLYSDTL
jgi:phosphoribulokinase